MAQHRDTRQRTFVVALLVGLVLCFFCALCHQASVTAPASAPAQASGSAQCTEASGAAGALGSDPTGSPEHNCEATEKQGLPTGAPLFLLGLGTVLAHGLLLAPRVAHTPRPAPSPPASSHGYALLTRLCIQRV